MKSQNIEDHRAHWTGIAVKNNWPITEIFLVIYRDSKGIIKDTVSHLGLNKDHEMVTEAYN